MSHDDDELRKWGIDPYELSAEYQRVNHILHEYFFFETSQKADLAELAVRWAMASLAGVDRGDACKSGFFALANMMYAGSDHAVNNLDETERHRIHEEAWADLTGIADDINQIKHACRQWLDDLVDDASIKPLAKYLFAVIDWIRAPGFIEPAHLSPVEFIVDCVTLSDVLAGIHPLVGKIYSNVGGATSASDTQRPQPDSRRLLFELHTAHMVKLAKSAKNMMDSVTNYEPT